MRGTSKKNSRALELAPEYMEDFYSNSYLYIICYYYYRRFNSRKTTSGRGQRKEAEMNCSTASGIVELMSFRAAIYRLSKFYSENRYLIDIIGEKHR